MWIKICGNTTFDDAQTAVEAGANALGFIFAESRRRVTPSQAREITQRLPKTVEKYGVFVDADYDEIVETVRVAGLTGVQLHGGGRNGLALRLREHFSGTPGRLGILQVVHYEGQDAEFEDRLKGLAADHAIDAVLVDSKTAKAVGGTGLAWDWQGAKASYFRVAPQFRLIVAGGLTPLNVSEAIYALQPWGVDVVSGVESEPGKKDSRKVFDFVRTAKIAGSSAKLAAAEFGLATTAVQGEN